MGKEIVLDAQEMEPPEPLVKALELAGLLGAGDYLRLRHRRDPILLYQNLTQRGFDHLTCAGVEVAYEVFIWRKGDAEAARAVEAVADKLSAPELAHP